MTGLYIIAVIVFTTVAADVGNQHVDDESLLCYKAPPAAGSEQKQLLLYTVKIPVPPLINVTKTGASASIFGKCGVILWVTCQISLTSIPPSARLECEYRNPARVYQTQLPVEDLQPISSDDPLKPSIVNATLTFNTIAASDGPLEFLCKVKFSYGGVLSESFINPEVTLEIKGCPHGRHGVWCDKLCSCANGVECHPFTAECVCPLGLQAERCDQAHPTLVRTGPGILFVPFGDVVMLTCIGYGMEPSLSRWEHNNMELQTVNHTEDVAYFPRPFHLNTTIAAINPDISGLYVCTFVNKDKVYRHNLTVILTDIPDPFLEAPMNETVVLGTRAELRCRTKPEAGTLTWERGNWSINQTGMRNQSIGESVMVREGNQTISITINAVRFDDAGRYTCIVGHVGADDDVIVDAWLTVQSQGTRPFLSTPALPSMPVPSDGVIVREGHKVMLSCFVSEAYPEPDIHWFIGGKDRTAESKLHSSMSSNGVSYDVHSVLSFYPTWLDNRKAVYCISTVADFQPRYNNDNFLNVSYAPKVSVSPDETTVQPNSSPSFRCDAPANPSATIYNWTLKRQDGDALMNYTGRRVVIHNVDSHYNKAILTCCATNDVGANSSKAVIKVFDDPDKKPRKRSLALMMVFLSLLLIMMLALPVVVYRHRGTIKDLFFRHEASFDQGKTHDVFVAYKGGREEEEFVINTLVPKLQEWGCDVCVHYQNFLPGKEIVENITAAISSSRKTLLVLSPDFVASEWCYFEFLCAMDEMLRNQTNFIIPLMFEEIRHEGLCHSMQHLIDTVSFIPWPTSGQTEEFWTLLKRAVETKFNVNKDCHSGVENHIYDLNDNETVLEI